jgi:hypothetical protein
MFSTRPMTPMALTLGLAAGQRVHEAGHGGGAAHVPLHVFHAVGRLDRDAAGVEADALADEGDGLVALLAAIPLHDGDLTVAHAAHADGQQGVEAELRQLLLAEDFDLQAELLEALHPLRELFGVQNVGGLADQIARELHGLGDGGQIAIRGHRPPWDRPRRSLIVSIDGVLSGFRVVRYFRKR